MNYMRRPPVVWIATGMAGEEGSSGETSPSEAHEVTEEYGNATVERHVPRVNCPEHIILVVDVCKEEGNTPYKLADGSKYSALYMVKRALTLFLQNKHAIDARHKFALVVLHESPIWLHDFTNNPREIIAELDELEDAVATSHCDLSLLFDLIAHQISLPQCSNPAVAPPPCIFRTVLLYGRSQCLPQFLGGKAMFTHLIQSPHFFLDMLYMHEAPSDENKCEGIFDLLCGLDESGWSYVLEVSRNATKLHNHCGTLLAHPLQRPTQKDIHYTLGGVD
ncbi:BRISC and BRCA1-A complex member 1-like isoform X1 [Panulirus ornatus]|uniref:BRISC and BRCA1-A complex member 1-like isoform X1 n=2 Tax=Panulirus ornatus TaxID=150431 RepID=UPI003A8792AE